nr:Hsp33 family molecular chaperone HslO [Clostridia bacterium]
TLYRSEGKLDVGAAVGRGTLTVIRDTGLGEPHIGSVELATGEVGDDLALYYVQSEQTPSAVGLGVRMDGTGILQAGGFLVQLMPGADDAFADWMQERVSGFPDVTWVLSEGFDPRQMLDLLMGDPDIVYLDSRPCGFRCDCSRDRMAGGLATLGRGELVPMLDEPDGIELTCRFCGTRYRFTRDELSVIAGQI